MNIFAGPQGVHLSEVLCSINIREYANEYIILQRKYFLMLTFRILDTLYDKKDRAVTLSTPLPSWQIDNP